MCAVCPLGRAVRLTHQRLAFPASSPGISLGPESNARRNSGCDRCIRTVSLRPRNTGRPPTFSTRRLASKPRPEEVHAPGRCRDGTLLPSMVGSHWLGNGTREEPDLDDHRHRVVPGVPTPSETSGIAETLRIEIQLAGQRIKLNASRSASSPSTRTRLSRGDVGASLRPIDSQVEVSLDACG